MADETKSPLARLIGNLDQRPYKVIPFPGREAPAAEATTTPTTVPGAMSARASPLPGAGAEVALWRLSQREEEESRKAAFAYVREKLKFSEVDLAYDEQRAVRDSVAVEILFRALRDPSNRQQTFAADAQELRDYLGSDELGALLIEYNNYCLERAPFHTAESPKKEVDELVALLGKEYPIETRVTYFDTVSLRRCLLTAVGMLVSLTTPSSSGSSSPSGSPPPPSGSSPA